MSSHRHVVPATRDHVERLAYKLRPIDALECTDWGLTPKEALTQGLQSGWSYTFMAGGRVKGMFGIHPTQATVWSLYAPLSRGDALYVMKRTPHWVRAFLAVTDNEPLWNIIRQDNTVALEWLMQSGCFDIDWESDIRVGSGRYHHFSTKPIGEIKALLDKTLEGTLTDV